MKTLLTLIAIFLFKSSLYSQNFLLAYEKHKLKNLSRVKPGKERNWFKNFYKSQTVELDSIFQSYKTKKGFDFNTADTIYLIYNWDISSPFISDIIIWSGKDTISYSQGYELIEPHKRRRIITYTPFLSDYEHIDGLKTVTERDSLVTLVSKRDYNTILHLGDNQGFNDGGKYHIYVAIKENNNYKIEFCGPRQFMIRTTHRKK